MSYTLHRLAITEYNGDPYFAMRNPDGEAFSLYDEEDMRAQYEMLKAYFEAGVISDEPVEIEELEGHWKEIWQATSIAREYAPKGYGNEQIQARLLRDAQAGRIPHAHLGIDGKTWWFSAGGLEQYLGTLRWGERRPVPASRYPTITLADRPIGIGHRTLEHLLDDGNEVAHTQGGVEYSLYLDTEGRIVGVVDEDYYQAIGLPVPTSVTGEPVARPADRQATNTLLRHYGYRWEKVTPEWLEANGEFEMVPGWYLYYGGRRVGMGEEAVERAFAEINQGTATAA